MEVEDPPRVEAERSMASTNGSQYGILSRAENNGIAFLLGSNYTGPNEPVTVSPLSCAVNNIGLWSRCLQNSNTIKWDIQDQREPVESIMDFIDKSIATKHTAFTTAKYILFYYYGHGALNDDKDEVLLLQSYNKVPIVSVMQKILDSAPKAKLFTFMFDCCRGGASSLHMEHWYSNRALEPVLDFGKWRVKKRWPCFEKPAVLLIQPVQSGESHSGVPECSKEFSGVSKFTLSVVKAFEGKSVAEAVSSIGNCKFGTPVCKLVGGSIPKDAKLFEKIPCTD